MIYLNPVVASCTLLLTMDGLVLGNLGYCLPWWIAVPPGQLPRAAAAFHSELCNHQWMTPCLQDCNFVEDEGYWLLNWMAIA